MDADSKIIDARNAFMPSLIPCAVGSFPVTDPDAIIEDIFTTFPEIPLWPQLPGRDYRESMYIQYSEGMPCLKEDPDGGKIYFDTTGDIYPELERVYEKYIGSDLEYFAISPDYARGLYSFLEALSSRHDREFRFLKGQVTGPVSFGLTVLDQDKRSILYNRELFDGVLKTLQMKALWQIEKLREHHHSVLIFVDEPYMSAFGSAFVNVTRDEVVDWLDEVFDGIHRQGALAGIHCCGNTDWALLMETSVDVINFDAFQYFQGVSIYADEWRDFLERGGKMAWGVIPSAASGGGDDIVDRDALAERVRTLFQAFLDKGHDRDLLLGNSLLTPTCGMGTIPVAAMRGIMTQLRDLSDSLRREFGLGPGSTR